MKSAIRGKNYNSVADIHLDIKIWIESKDSNFFHNAFRKLPERWRRCIDDHGDYFEQLKQTKA